AGFQFHRGVRGARGDEDRAQPIYHGSAVDARVARRVGRTDDEHPGARETQHGVAAVRLDLSPVADPHPAFRRREVLEEGIIADLQVADPAGDRLAGRLIDYPPGNLQTALQLDVDFDRLEPGRV